MRTVTQELHYDIGLVYKPHFSKNLFLAVSSRKLITVKNNKLVERRPNIQYEKYPHISVEELSERWKIDLDTFDWITQKYLQPRINPYKVRKPKSKLTPEQVLEFNKKLRTARLCGLN